MRFWILLASCFLIFSLSADKWMDEQISEDLAPFTEASLSPKAIKEEFKAFSQLKRARSYENWGALITIKNGRASADLVNPNPQQNRIKFVVSYLNHLGRRRQLPDVSFILANGDGVTEPFGFPVFAFAKNREAAGAVLFPDFEACENPSKGSHPGFCNKYSWKKKASQGFFRGATMGPWEPSAPAFNNQRARIVELSYFYPHLIDASFSHFSHEIDQVLPDVKDWMQAMGKSLDPRPVRTYFRYKYLLDIDGNSCTYSWFRWILFSNSTPLKVLSNNIQWYYGALVPFEHYIPIKEDFSDLVEMINFLKEHDDDAKAVAQNGQKIAREIFSQEKVDEYTVKLLRAYAKLFN